VATSAASSEAVEADRGSKPGRSAAGRFPALVFVGVEAIAAVSMLWWERGTWFLLDDWDFLSNRTAWNLGDLFRPHYQHWMTLPLLGYRLMWQLVGLRTAVPYQALSIFSHLVVAALLRLVMRRAGVGPWLATVAATLFVFLGAGAQTILWVAAVGFVGAVLFGLVHLLLTDHDGPIDRRDWLGLMAGVASLMCSGVAISMVIVVGYAALLRRGWRVAVLHTVPLGVVYAIWLFFAPPGSVDPTYSRTSSPITIGRFVAVGFRATFRGLGQLPGVGLALGVLLALSFVVTVRAPWHIVRTRAAVPIALFAGAITFLVITGLYRAGTERGVAAAVYISGPEHAREQRYVYVVAAMVMPSVALAAQYVITRWRRAAVVIVALLLIGLPGNIGKLASYNDATRSPYLRARRSFILTAPTLPIARQLPRSLPLGISLTLGWLIDSEPSGRIPKPPARLPARTIAGETLALALAPASTPRRSPCVVLVHPIVRTLQQGELLTLRTGKALIVYVPATGPASPSEPIAPSTLVALAGPLRLRITPASPNPTLCG
jgi:hypothetical protein